MKYNYNYINNDGEAAPYILKSGDVQIINPTEEQYAGAGFYPYHPEATFLEPDPIIAEIVQLKQQLADTDYIALKYVEGYDCDELYPGWKEQRMAIRDRINELEK